MATLNIKIDPAAAVRGASQIEGAIDRVRISATTASTAIATLERSAFRNLGVLNQSFRTSTSQLKEFDQNLTKINPSMNKLSDGFGSVHRSSTLAIGSVTKFFGQMAIGVFLVGELVLIFSALARGISAVSRAMDSMEVSQITYQFAVMKDQLKNIVADVFSKFSSGVLESFQNINKWIAQNKQDIENFLESTINFMKGAFDSIKSIVQFLIQHEEMLSMGIIGFAMFGKGRGVALASFAMAEKMIRMVLAMSSALEAVQSKKITWGELFEKSGGLFGGTNQLENALEQLNLLSKEGSGIATISEKIKLAKMEIVDLQKEIDSLKVAQPTANELIAGKGPKIIEYLEKKHQLTLKLTQAQQTLNDLETKKENIEIPSLSRYSKEWLDAQKEIFKETKIMTDEFYDYQEARQNVALLGMDLMMSGDKDSLWAMTALRAQKDYSLWMDKNARSMSIYSGSLKTTKIMSQDYYNILIKGEDLFHEAMLRRTKTSAEVTAEMIRHSTQRSAIDKQMYGELIDLDKMFLAIRLENEAAWVAYKDSHKIEIGSTWGDKTTKDLMDQGPYNDMTAIANLVSELKNLENVTEKFRTAQEKYTSVTSKLTVQGYDLQVKKLKELEIELITAGLAINEVREIIEKMQRSLDIRFLEGQDDLSSGFLAGLLRLKDEIEPWGKTMSDAVVNAAHDMYNAMDDFFFDALEGRMKSFEEYFSGFMSIINKITASYLTENLKRGFASLLPSATVQAGGQQVSGPGVAGSVFSLGSYLNPATNGYYGQANRTTGGYRAGIPNAEWWGESQDKNQSPGWGPYAASGITGAAALYSIWQQSQGISKPKAAVGGALAGAASGAAAGGYSTSWTGYGAIIGAAIGAIVGGISGYLGGADAPEKAKFRLGAGVNVNTRYPNVDTPFGAFGFDQASVIDTNRFKMVMAQVGEATDAIADVMDSTSIERVKSALAGWRSGSAKGDISAAAFEEQFKNYFAEIGATWGTEFGAWMQNFNGTLDDLVSGIQKHVEAIKFTQDILDPQNLTEYDQEVNTFNDSIDTMRQNLKDTGGSIQELTDLEAARAKGLEDLRQVYADSFEMLKMQMGGMSQQNAQMTMWAKKFGTDVPTIISAWEGIEAALQGMTWEEFEAAVQASDMTIGEATQALLAFDAAAAATAAMIYDINLQSGQMAGMFSDLDIQIMSINKQFEDWIFQTKDFANASEIAIELERRRTAAIEDAMKVYEASILSLKAGLAGISANQSRQYQLEAIALKYGLNPSDINASNLRSWLPAMQASGTMTSEQQADWNTAWNLIFGTSGSFGTLTETVDDSSNAFNAMNDAAKNLVDDWKKLADDVKSDIEGMMFSSDNPRDVLERMGLVRAEIAGLGTIDNPEEGQRARELWNTLLDLGQEAWQRPSLEYQALFDEVLTGLQGIGTLAEDQQTVLLGEIASNTATINENLTAWNGQFTTISQSFTSSVDNLSTIFSAFLSSGSNPMQALYPDVELPSIGGGGNQTLIDLIKLLRPESFQSGGIFNDPVGLAALHGPEAIIPLHNGYVPVEIQGGSTGDTIFQITIQIDGVTKDPGETRRQAREGVLEAIRSPEVQAELRRQKRWGG